MPTKTKDFRYEVTGGYTLYSKTGREDHSPALLGYTQSITSAYPKGTRLILLREPITGAYYPPLKPVTFDKQMLTASGIDRQMFWCFADGYTYLYNEPSGNANLAWFIDERALSGISHPSQASKDRALTMALSRVAESPFMGAVDLGEVKETLQFLRKPFSGLRDVLGGYSRKVDERLATKRNISPKRYSRRYKPKVDVQMDKNKWRSDVAADTWLEYRYAASPLVLSATGLAETAATQVTDLIQRIHTAKGAHKDTSVTTEDRGVDWILNGEHESGARRAASVQRKTEIKASYVIRYIYRPWMVDAINLARYGISPTQILSTGYELLKLSWMADWFWNMGNWIKAMEPKPQCQILDICFTETYLGEINVMDAGGSWSYYGFCLPPVKTCASTFTRSYMDRSIVTNTLQAPTPRITADYVTVSRILDSVALLWRPSANIARRYNNPKGRA